MVNDAKNPKDGPISTLPSGEVQSTGIIACSTMYRFTVSLLVLVFRHLLSIINKWASHEVPLPGALSCVRKDTSQSFFGVLLFGKLKILEHDSLHFLTMWRFLPAQ
ncbi:hypothetical protein IFM89_016893 [Coptis chinensis]|uniref:Uncharacterized protein n=1 Tax=Coptis chinensis TaxID=261450 RepID=A0A835LYC5_9MAGN|nr:hypothetical protein IFM89_016893 [Coptis chinensis]